MHLITKIKALPEILIPEILIPEIPYSKFSDADYLAVMCHEIGTPLAAIVGLTHILGNDKASQKTKDECAIMLRDSSNMLMGLMRNMLDSARLGSGLMEIEAIEFDISKVIGEVANIIAIKVAEKGLQLTVHIADGVPTHAIGDPLRIRQILLNLLSNAVKFTEKGLISLYASIEPNMFGGHQLSLLVVDTGIGMTKESLEKIFDKYRQANAGISREYGGTGLGLSISQDLAHLMDGDIKVTSSPGIGSHFTVSLPLKIPKALIAVV